MNTPLTVTRIGHACQLIEFGDIRVLADPWFTQTATYYQGEAVAVSVPSLGRVDAVVITYEHYDPQHAHAAGCALGEDVTGPRCVGGASRTTAQLSESPTLIGSRSSFPGRL